MSQVAPRRPSSEGSDQARVVAPIPEPPAVPPRLQGPRHWTRLRPLPPPHWPTVPEPPRRQRRHKATPTRPPGQRLTIFQA
eukprot:9020287-Alexandrium_andersonii.AAC.1